MEGQGIGNSFSAHPQLVFSKFGSSAARFSRQLAKEASSQKRFHKSALGKPSAFDRHGERKTVTRGDSDSSCASTAPKGSNDNVSP